MPLKEPYHYLGPLGYRARPWLQGQTHGRPCRADGRQRSGSSATPNHNLRRGSCGGPPALLYPGELMFMTRSFFMGNSLSISPSLPIKHHPAQPPLPALHARPFKRLLDHPLLLCYLPFTPYITPLTLGSPLHHPDSIMTITPPSHLHHLTHLPHLDLALPFPFPLSPFSVVRYSLNSHLFFILILSYTDIRS